MSEITPTPAGAASLLKERRLAFALLLGAVCCIGMGQTVTFSILPPIGRELGLSERQVGLIFSVSALLWVVTSPLWGRMSDRFGRKPILIVGMLGYIVSTIGFVSVISHGLTGASALTLVYVLMIATRSIYGLIGPGVRVASQAYIVDRTDRKDRTVAIAGMAAAFGLGNVLGPGLGSAFSVFGLLAPFWLIVGLVATVMIATIVLLPEKSAPGQRRQQVKLSFRDPRLGAFVLYGLLVSFAVATPMQTSAFLFIDVLEFSTDEAAQYVGVGLSGAAMAALFSQLVLVQRFRLSPRTMMISGACLIGAAQLGLAFGQSFAPVVFALMLNGLGAGLALPGFSAGASLAVSADEQGAVAGLTGALNAAGFSIVPVIHLTLYAISPVWPFLLNSVLMVAMVILTLNHRGLRRSGDTDLEEPEEPPVAS
ncbi:MAG: MFS transporter [Pseudomonadota bacterium]